MTAIFLCCAAACFVFLAVACVRAARVERAERLQGNLLYRVFEDEARREEMMGGMASLNLEPNNGAPLPCRACRVMGAHCDTLYFWLAVAVAVLAAMAAERWARG